MNERFIEQLMMQSDISEDDYSSIHSPEKSPEKPLISQRMLLKQNSSSLDLNDTTI